MKKVLLLMLLVFPLMMGSSYAQRLVYQPKNPAFGGNTFNYQWMLSSAQAQDTQIDPASQVDPMDEFADNLNRQVLNRLAREIVDLQFGMDDFSEGSYNLGDYRVNVNDGGSGIIVTIVDSRTGGSTVVEVPRN
jgi:curli production assembly/transport component CsgF